MDKVVLSGGCFKIQVLVGWEGGGIYENNARWLDFLKLNGQQDSFRTAVYVVNLLKTIWEPMKTPSHSRTSAQAFASWDLQSKSIKEDIAIKKKSYRLRYGSIPVILALRRLKLEDQEIKARRSVSVWAAQWVQSWLGWYRESLSHKTNKQTSQNKTLKVVQRICPEIFISFYL